MVSPQNFILKDRCTTMDYPHHTPESRKNKHLNDFERGQLKLLIDENRSPYYIAKKLKRSSNTIRNELKRGTVAQKRNGKTILIYLPDAGKAIYDRNRLNSRKPYKYVECSKFIQHVDEKLKANKHSVDAICGRAKIEGTYEAVNRVCTKTIYNYIDLGLMQCKNIDLPQKTKRSTKPRRVRKNKKILGKSISERPEYINDRSDFGHWEIDCIIGKKTQGESVLLTLTERKTRMEIIRKLPAKSSWAVQRAMQKLKEDAGELFSLTFKSITADNGSEFSELALFEGSEIYFAHPYSSCERGTNEHHNGLIRRFIPKGRSINPYPVTAIEAIQCWCNTLPRRILGYMTPQEAFEREVFMLSA